MSMSLKERTVLPPADPSTLSRFARGLSVEGQAKARLIGPDGAEVEIPVEVYGLLVEVVTALSQGTAISIAPHNTMLTTQEAADMLSVSRPTLVRLLADGEIPHTLRGRHRRVLLRDVVDYSERTRSGRQSTLDEMTAEAEDMGLYDM
jgi:excisionase family DNA binding protein